MNVCVLYSHTSISTTSESLCRINKYRASLIWNKWINKSTQTVAVLHRQESQIAGFGKYKNGAKMLKHKIWSRKSCNRWICLTDHQIPKHCIMVCNTQTQDFETLVSWEDCVNMYACMWLASVAPYQMTSCCIASKVEPVFFFSFFFCQMILHCFGRTHCCTDGLAPFKWMTCIFFHTELLSVWLRPYFIKGQPWSASGLKE